VEILLFCERQMSDGVAKPPRGEEGPTPGILTPNDVPGPKCQM